MRRLYIHMHFRAIPHLRHHKWRGSINIIYIYSFASMHFRAIPQLHLRAIRHPISAMGVIPAGCWCAMEAWPCDQIIESWRCKDRHARACMVNNDSTITIVKRRCTLYIYMYSVAKVHYRAKVYVIAVEHKKIMCKLGPQPGSFIA